MAKVIESLKVDDYQLIIKFTDGTGVEIVDQAQYCCENRYMTSDDDPNHYIGAEYRGYELADVSDDYDDRKYMAHDIQFLNIKTSIGDFQVASHNEHNGYYGGFDIVERKLD